MDSSNASSSSSSTLFIIPDTPPSERELNYWEQQKQQKKQQKSLSSAATSAATAVASTSGASSSSPLKMQGIFVQREDKKEVIIPDTSPLPQATPATWAPRRAALTSVPAAKQPVKRRLVFDDEPAVLTQSKKRAAQEHDSSMTPLLREEEEEDELDVETEDFLAIINRHTEKPWTPLRQLVEDTAYPIVGVREITNQHGHRIVLKVHLTSVRLTDIYMPERYTHSLTSKDIESFKRNCKSLCLFVKHVNAFLTDIKIVECKISKFGI
ncbi:uncharacterized protein LOC120355195 [Nilaparvata lugens]|uniref:uncharacterized protein LOC120355195 n=1 Tax=Nilaparvata lugens TaxID=108931 RepID=UPI00193DE2D2|nr:uncharacterized protein LOC120355195 [Nilaparvata lugens]